MRNPYNKVERNFPTAREVSKKDCITIGKAFVKIAGRYGMTIRPCAEGNELEEYGVDIGAYDTCGHLCRYCYANTNAALVKENMRRHNPKSAFLLGERMPGDCIHEAVQRSWIDSQLCLKF